MRVSCHLTFNGECEVAFLFYAACLGGTITTMLKYGESGLASQVPLEWQGRVLHASLMAGDLVLAGVDAAPGEYVRPQGFFALLDLNEVAEAERIFTALAERGVIRMPLQETFWAQRFGMVTDRFGIPWEINCGAAQGL